MPEFPQKLTGFVGFRAPHNGFSAVQQGLAPDFMDEPWLCAARQCHACKLDQQEGPWPCVPEEIKYIDRLFQRAST